MVRRPRVFTRRFQSTLPVWGATITPDQLLSDTLFQSTLPVWGATRPGHSLVAIEIFQSTLPVWGATWTNSLSKSLT